LLPLHFSFIDSAMLYVQVNEQPACTFPWLWTYWEESFAALKEAGEIIKDVSGINIQGWSLLKLATALTTTENSKRHTFFSSRRFCHPI
jgi:hypothetical protein